MQVTRRLTDYFDPKNYNLSVQIDRLERTFSGVVVITGTATSAGSLWLHSKGLTIESCQINGTSIEAIAHENDELELKIDATDGSDYTITTVFSGTITDQMHGMYPCYYEHDGAAKELIATQFESHHAREVFPCLDE